MRKICAVVFCLALLVCSFGFSSYAAEEDSYTYSCIDSLASYSVYQDFEELEPMADYSTTALDDGTGNLYAFFSFMGIEGGAMVTDKDAISDDISLKLKGLCDIRRWTIDSMAALSHDDSDGYVFQFKVRFDTMPAGSVFTLKITDTTSPSHDNENGENATIHFTGTDDGKVSVTNLSNTEVAVLELNKAYSIAIVCEFESTNYYFFIDDKYVPGSKAEFNCEFNTLSALRFDLTEGAEVTLDDLLFDGCDIRSGSTSPTPAATPEASSEATESAGTATSSASAAPVTQKPAAATQPATAASDAEGISTGLVIGIVAAAVIVIVVVVVIVIAKSKKKK